MNPSKLVNAVITFVTTDVKKTATYYHDILGFRVVPHYDNAEPFAALYHDAVEIIVVQAKFGEILPNRTRFGAGYDAYLDPDTVEGVDAFYQEWKAKGAKIAVEPFVTPYGSYEFVIEDIDGRLIGIGRVKDKEIFFGENKF
ncbi:MAG: VOC family protein [Anaerolineaceae bacterium]|jgi:catechol 2,3-dioxygenase-like lactoylglutathione lyase family enzyme